MSEEQADYLAEQGYVAEAIAMLGVGYAAEIERPRTVNAIGDKGLEEYKAYGWVKMSAKFCPHIKRLRGAKLSVWLCIALNIDESGHCNLTQKELSAMTGYSHTEVIDSVKELSEIGFLSVDRSGKKNIYQPAFVAKGKGNNPSKETLVKKLDSTPLDSLESSPSLINSVPTSIKKKKDIMDGILENQAITEPIHQACLSFETALLGSTVSQWPWSSNRVWQKFAKWVAAQDPHEFVRYAEWRRGDGKFHAMSNNKIRQDPQMFMDTGWPTFLAHSSMYQSKDRSFGL